MNDIELQLLRVKHECHNLSILLPYEKVRIEYNKTRRVNDEGLVTVMPIISSFTS